MQLTARKSLNKAYLKAPLSRELLDLFKKNFLDFARRVDPSASEEFNKNLLADLLKNTFYSPGFFLNVSERIDLAIHLDPAPSSHVGVIIETKRGDNVAEMATTKKLNSKAMQELLLYYLKERIGRGNNHIRRLLITNFEEWFIFDALEFDRFFFRNTSLVRDFKDFAAGRLVSATTDFFYKNVAEPAIASAEERISFTHFTTSEIATLVSKGEVANAQLIPFIKVFSPEHLLKLPFQNDNNSLNKSFFDELLHIIGLQETREKAKKVIARKPVGRREAASLIENTIAQLKSLDRLVNVKDLVSFGLTEEEQLFNVALALSLTWINRVLFLKLLEAQLLRYHGGDRAFAFLNSEQIKTYGDLNVLFFQVLAEPVSSRPAHANEKFPKVPYLNSSLFEVTDLERQTLAVSNLLDNLPLSAPLRTIFKSGAGKRFSGGKPSLAYLFEFLDSYDFSSDGSQDIQTGKSLINASVLGLIFEKINGYKDGSFFTPGFITMNMARATLVRAVIKRFSDACNKPLTSLDDVYNSIPSGAEGLQKANEIFNAITVCDPAVGSGHFLVSALNELLALKSHLGILVDAAGRRLKNYVVTVESDELVITDEDSNIFSYRPGNPESHRVQETIFNEKRRLIEGCLFGVDLNRNSVNICRLRLWIELLKHSYYRADGTLETLPNLDINIKAGNSLLSRFELNSDLKEYLKKHKTSMSEYRRAVQQYKSARDKTEKRELENLIDKLKSGFKREILYNDPLLLKVETLKRQARTLETSQSLFGETPDEKRKRVATRAKYLVQLARHEATLRELEANKIFEHAFEWRIEFPEVLDDRGDFIGFDVILGNPPYVSAIALQKAVGVKEYKYLKDMYVTAKGTVDLYVYFFELAGRLAMPNASICYITPNRYLSADYGGALRRFLIDGFTFLRLVDYSRVDVFESAATYPVITHLTKGRQAEYVGSVVTEGIEGQPELRSFSSSDLGFTADANLGFLLSDKFAIAKKIALASVPLTRAGLINATSTAAESEAFSKHISEAEGGFKLLNTGTIDRYVSKWGRSPLTDKGRRFLAPTLLRDPVILGNRFGLYSSPKIIFAKIALRNEAFYDEHGVFASINTNCMHTFNKDFHPKFVLAWLNSRLFQYTYECFFDALRMAGRHLPFTAPYLVNMCINEADAATQARIAVLVDKLVAQLATGIDTEDVERRIDLAIYELYNLTSAEIDKVDSAFSSTIATVDGLHLEETEDV